MIGYADAAEPAVAGNAGDVELAEDVDVAEDSELADGSEGDADDGLPLRRVRGLPRPVPPACLTDRIPKTPPEPRGLQWQVARSAALVFLGVALAVGAALFLMRSSEPSAAAVAVQLDAEGSAPVGGGPPDGEGDGAAGDRATGRGVAPQGVGGGTPTDGNAPGAASSGAASSGDASSGDATRGGAPHGEAVVVYVTGAVASPGVVTVPAGTRLFEIIEQVGGALPEADLEGINLAATPSDGQHVHLLAVGEEPRLAPPDPSGSGPVPGTASGAAPGGGAGTTGGSAGPAAVLDINTASLADIESLPRVGPVLGQRIIDWRDEHGPFAQASDIDAVPGIGPALLEGILPLIVVR